MMKNLLSLFLLVLVAACASVNAFTGYTPVLSRTPQSSYSAGASSSSSRADLMTMRARVCDLLGKKPNRQARVVTFSHTRNKKVQFVNLQTKRYFSERLSRNVRLRLSTKGIKTVDKMGGSIDAAAKKFGIDLSQF